VHIGSTQWDRERILSRLAELAAGDPSQAVMYQLNAALPEDQLHRFEQRYDVSLPGSYRSFISDIGDGGAGPHGGVWSLERSYGQKDEDWWPGFLATPFPHTSTVDEGSLDEDYDEDEQVAGSMIISDLGCGTFARLVVTGEAKGRVWVDSLGVDGQLTQGPDFMDWYLSWLLSGENPNQ
jgi:SMI1/KNR4 family protein SUKH-1